MTKTLTEQWRDGTLPEGWYYVVREWDDEIRMLYFEGDYFLDTDVPLDNDNIKEVLGPVPDYMDCKGLIYDSINLADARKRIDELVSKTDKLEKKLEIANKALKKYMTFCRHPAEEAIKEMKGIK